MSLFQLLSVSHSGMSAQRQRAELIVENLANAETTRSVDGGPYRRKDVLFESQEQTSPFSAVFQTSWNSGMQGVGVSEVVVDMREPDRRYIPGHPDADAEGYVAFPRLNPAEEMADLMNASRGYQANVSAMSVVKDMIHRSLDLMK